MDEYRPDHEPGGQRTDDRPRRAPPVVHDRHGHAGRLFHQPPDNVHALRDTPHVPVADFPGPPVHGHLRHPPHGITERAERPPRSEDHTSELQSHSDLVCRLLLEQKNHPPPPPTPPSPPPPTP